MSRHRKLPDPPPQLPVSRDEFSAYAAGMLKSLSLAALRFDMPILAHLIDLAASEAAHHARKTQSSK